MAITGYVFREKWKQILAKSLGQDLERLKHELSLEQAKHAASLAPQLEVIKHDFQQKLEAYKISLIAQAEAAKLQGELKRAIATRFVEIEFTRLIQLETDLSRAASTMFGMTACPAPARSADQFTDAIALLQALQVAVGQCEMFLAPSERLELAKYVGLLSNLLDNIGPGKSEVLIDDPIRKVQAMKRMSIENLIRLKITEKARVPS